jgi:DNA-binding SARP family transcriptional activator
MIAVRLLGSPRIERDGAPLTVSAKAVALIGYLAASRTAQSREHILATLWPESSDEAARKNLRNTLWSIRREAGADLLVAAEDRLLLNPATQVDLWQFNELIELPPAELAAHQEAVLRLVRGPLLDGLTLLDAPDFELWLTMERERLGQLTMRTLAALVDAQRWAGEWVQVLTVARCALSLDPLAEPMYQAVMEAHARLGERAEALRQYDVLAATLERELGVDPLPETSTLREQILSQTLSPLPPADAPAPSSPPRLIGSGAPQPPFVGRAEQWRALDGALERARGGGLQIVLLTGEVGIGKSRLLSEWGKSRPAEITVLLMRCLESTQTLPFAPLTELFSNRVCIETLFKGASPLPLMWLAEVARLLPELRTLWPNLPVPPTLPADEERRRVFEAFAQCIRALVGAGLVLAIDDLQWADATTSAWLDYAVHRLHDLPIVLVGTYRAEDATPALTRLIASWGRSGLASKVALDHLSRSETNALLTHAGVDPEQAASIQSQSAGNPLFLLQLSRNSSDDIPPMLADLIQARLERLPTAATQLMQAAAVLDGNFSFATLRSTAGRSEEETLDGLDALLQADIVRENGDSYSFTHPLVASVVRTGMSHARSVFLHRRAAQARERDHAHRLAPIAGRLLAHYRAAGDSERAAFYADMAASHALSLSAPAEAAAFYTAALELAPTPARYLGLGNALSWQGDLPAARRAYETALTDYEQAGRWSDVARACGLLGSTYLAAGRPEVTIGLAERALQALAKNGSDPEQYAEAYLMLGISQRFAGYPLAEAQAHLQAALAVASERHLTSLMGRCEFELANVMAQNGDLAGALRTFEASIDHSAQAQDYFQCVLSHNNAAYNATQAGDLATAHRHIAAGLELAEHWSLRVPLQYLYSTRGEIALAEQDWDAAASWFERGMAEAASHDNAAQVANYKANLALARRGRGDLDGALALLRVASTEAALLTAPYLQTQIDLWLAETWGMRGDTLAAEAALARAHARLEGNEHGWLSAWAERIEAGQQVEARSSAARNP